MRRDVKSHIYNCITCSKNLSQCFISPPVAPRNSQSSLCMCIAIHTIGKLPVTTAGNKYALTCIDLLTSHVIAVPMPDKTAESVVEAYLSGVLSRTGASVVCLSDNGSELKSNQMNTVLKQLGIRHIFSNPYRLQGNFHIDDMYITSLKEH